MDLATVILWFLLLYFMQWLYIMQSCEKKVVLVSTNQSNFDDMNRCLNSYSTPFSLEIFIVYIVEKISFVISKVYEEAANIIIIVVVMIFIYAGINPHSNARNTLRDIINAIRQDISTICRELWSSFEQAFTTLYNTLTIVKISEIIIMSALLSKLPDMLSFFRQR